MKKDIVIAVIAVVLVAGIAYGLNAMRPELPLTPSRPHVAPLAPSMKADKKMGPVVMRVNGEAVTEAEFVAFAENAPEQNREFLVSTPEGRNLLANEVVKLKTLEQEAEKLGITKEADVQTQLSMLRAQVVASRTLQKLVQQNVEQRIRLEYEKEKNNTITLRHIVVAYAGGQIPSSHGKAMPVPQATTKARALADRIRGGATFEDVARTESDHAESARLGGSLGPTRREMLPPEIGGVVNRLQPGQVSEPVQTPLGIHIFRVDQPSLDELRPVLMRRAQEEAVQEALDRLTKNAKVDKDAKFFANPRATPPPGTAKSNG